MAGIKETKELIDGALVIGSVVYKQLLDGFQFEDAIALIPALVILPNAIKGIDQVPGEVADLDAAERDELIALVEQKLDIDNERAKKIAAKALRAGLAIGELVAAIGAEVDAPL